jgi:hypothetical protein
MTTQQRDDAAKRRAIMRATHNPQRCVRLLVDYYSDDDRIDRTPRETLLLHLGVLTGILTFLVEI